MFWCFFEFSLSLCSFSFPLHLLFKFPAPASQNKPKKRGIETKWKGEKMQSNKDTQGQTQEEQSQKTTEETAPRDAPITSDSSLRDVSKLLARRPPARKGAGRSDAARREAAAAEAAAEAAARAERAERAAAAAALPSGPHVMVDADGQIVLDQSTLQVTVDGARGGGGEGADDAARYRGYARVEEGESALMGGSHRLAYSKRGVLPRRVERWSCEETARFFQGLRVFGTDFTLLAGLFARDGRDRRQLKAKYKKEEREHPELIDLALRSHLPLTEHDLVRAGVFVDGSLPSRPLGAAPGTDNDDTNDSAAGGTDVNADADTRPAAKRPRTDDDDDDKDDDELERELFAEDDEEDVEDEEKAPEE